jgi:hypothetical protein
MRKRLIGLTLLVSFSNLFVGGCMFNSLQRNVWRGFGYSIGALPANIVTSAITDVLTTAGIIPAQQ